jgi:hypothetical protein
VQEISTPVIILAVNDLRLLRMNLQSALGKALLKRISELLRLLFTDTGRERHRRIARMGRPDK